MRRPAVEGADGLVVEEPGGEGLAVALMVELEGQQFVEVEGGGAADWGDFGVAFRMVETQLDGVVVLALVEGDFKFGVGGGMEGHAITAPTPVSRSGWPTLLEVDPSKVGAYTGL